jgi:hypothetical protein
MKLTTETVTETHGASEAAEIPVVFVAHSRFAVKPD